MPIICPTVTADDPHVFRTQIERIQLFAPRIHIDLADGIFAPKLLDISQVWLPENIKVDIHLMFLNPLEVADAAIALKPQLIIIQAESDGNFHELVDKLHKANIKVGVALLASTPIEVILSEIDSINHILIFSGNLGHFGGQADLGLLKKVETIKALKRPIEIGWDGGINEENVKSLADSGVEVMNVGGFIQRSDNPVDAYAKLNLAIMDGQ